MKLTYGDFQYVWERLPKETQETVKAKCVWEQMNPWGVLNEWNAYIPPDLRRHIGAERGEP